MTTSSSTIQIIVGAQIARASTNVECAWTCLGSARIIERSVIDIGLFQEQCGQSLIVTAIAEGRQTAACVGRYLMSRTASY